MNENPSQMPKNSIIKQLFEEGIKNAIRIVIGALMLLAVYALFFERKGYYLFVEAEGNNLLSEQFISSEISNSISEIIKSPSRYSRRYSSALEVGTPIQSNEAFDLEIYSKLSVKRILRYFNLIPNTIECTIGADSTGYYCVLMIDSVGINKVNNKISNKNLHSLLQSCGEAIVEYYEPKTLLPFLFVNEDFARAEMLSQRLIASKVERDKHFYRNQKDTSLLSDFAIRQIYTNTLISRYSKFLSKKETEKNYNFIQAKINKSFADLRKSITDEKKDLSVYHFTKGNHFIACEKFDMAIIEFDSAYNLVADTIKLSQARILNNKAYAIYHLSTKKLQLAHTVIDTAISHIKDLYENMPAEHINNIRQVWGLCLSTKCEILWTESHNNIEQIKGLLIEVKINDKTFKFDKKLVKNDPMYKFIVRQARTDKVWSDAIKKLMQTDEERKYFDKM